VASQQLKKHHRRREYYCCCHHYNKLSASSLIRCGRNEQHTNQYLLSALSKGYCLFVSWFLALVSCALTSSSRRTRFLAENSTNLSRLGPSLKSPVRSSVYYRHRPTGGGLLQPARLNESRGSKTSEEEGLRSLDRYCLVVVAITLLCTYTTTQQAPRLLAQLNGGFGLIILATSQPITTQRGHRRARGYSSAIQGHTGQQGIDIVHSRCWRRPASSIFTICCCVS